MKHSIMKWGVCLSLFLGFCSCDDMLQLEPQNNPTFYNFFKDEKDFQNLMMAAYFDYRNSYTYINRRWAGEIFDESTDATLRLFQNLDPVNLNSSDTKMSWAIYYKIIQQTLLVTENIDRVEMPEERRNFWIGQALFYRALCYFEVIRDWGDCPLLPGAEIVVPLGREPWPEMLDRAIGDMKTATELLEPWKTLQLCDRTVVTTKQIPGKEAAYAILAHMYAWKGNLLKDDKAIGKAIDAATYVIVNAGVGVDPNPETICTKLYSGGHPESVFECSIDYTELTTPRAWMHPERLYQCYPLKGNSKVGDIYGVDSRLSADRVMKMYSEYNGQVDLRRNAYFYKVKEMKGETPEGWTFMQKRRTVLEDRTTYPNFPSMWFVNFGGDIVVTRLADIILLRAECYAKLGKDDLAIPDLNRIRKRAKAREYDSSEGSVYRMVFEEREKELICERHRLYDLIRTGYWKTDFTPAYSKLTDQDVEDGALFIPVYDAAFSLNPLMRQNRYWDKKK